MGVFIFPKISMPYSQLDQYEGAINRGGLLIPVNRPEE